MKKRKLLMFLQRQGSRSLSLLLLLAFMAIGTQQAVAQQYYEGAEAVEVLVTTYENTAKANSQSDWLTPDEPQGYKAEYLKGLMSKVQQAQGESTKVILDAFHQEFLQNTPDAAKNATQYYDAADALLQI